MTVIGSLAYRTSTTIETETITTATNQLSADEPVPEAQPNGWP
jgi:hypothetical protein